MQLRRKERTMSELKPCPFCGSEKIQFAVEGYFRPWANEGMKLWYHCACYECGSEMDSGSAVDMKRAIEVWNRRVDNEC